jgi:F-type H+-transporting ATPase subunit delta
VASAAAKRYAKAVFEVAQSEGRIEHWEHSLARLHELLSDPKVAEVLSNPTIAASERMQFVAESPHLVDPEATNLAKLLIESNRVRDIDGIVDEYDRLADDAAGRVRATVTTAIELGPHDRDRITKDLSKRLNKEVKLRVEVDPRILGGLKLQYGDHVVDGTVATKLQQLRRRLVAS